MSDFTAPDRHSAAPRTVLEGLKAELDAKVEGTPVSLQVPGRDGLSVIFSTSLDFEEIAAIRKKHAPKGMAPEIAQLRFGGALLIAKCVGITKDGHRLGGDEDSWTFLTKELHDLLGCVGPEDTLRKFYARDPHIVATANTLLREAGFEDEVVKDPTAR